MIKGYIHKIRTGNCSTAELTLTGICLVLFGMAIGMIIAPAKIAVMGSFNGNQGSVKNPKLIKK